MTDKEFWAEVYLQNIRNGVQHDQAVARANDAVAKRNGADPGTQ
jgi:hypothetical protein